jgi:hypothetical protein
MNLRRFFPNRCRKIIFAQEWSYAIYTTWASIVLCWWKLSLIEPVLITKLHCQNYTHNLWILAYLKIQSQVTVFSCDYLAILTLQIPQASLLGPILFTKSKLSVNLRTNFKDKYMASLKFQINLYYFPFPVKILQ